MQHKQAMPKSRTRNLQGHSKEDLRQKGAAAVFRAACSINQTCSRNRLKLQSKFQWIFESIFLTILVPSWEPPGHHLGSKIRKNEAPLRSTRPVRKHPHPAFNPKGPGAQKRSKHQSNKL